MSGMKHRAFPEGFLWGASTAAHQVEGNNTNQWSEWEKANAKYLAANAYSRLMIDAKKYLGWDVDWEAVKSRAERPENYISGDAADHYRRYKDDFMILKQLNLNAFRFSIEWSRIEPEEGKWDEDEIEHYRRYLHELKQQGIEPIVTLWHWTVPVWFAERGGFERQENVRYFERFITKIADELGDDFSYVTLLNEPNVYVYASYLIGQWPPEKRSALMAIKVYHNLQIAHKRGYAMLKQRHPAMKIGIAFALGDMQPAQPRNMLSRLVATVAAYMQNWWYLNRISKELDFIGVNYYMTTYFTWRGVMQYSQAPKSDAGWHMEPKDLERVLLATWKRYRKPIIITENGLADGGDVHRQWWLEQTIEAMQAALAKGVDLRGYLHWSLLDNFEWSFGWWPKFGLVAVDRKTMKRVVRPSAKWFADFIKQTAAKSTNTNGTELRAPAPKQQQLSRRHGK